MLITKDNRVAIPLKHVEYKGEALGGICLYTVRQRYHNSDICPINVKYRIPAPYNGMITSFCAETEQGTIQSSLMTIAEARACARTAEEQGCASALLTMDTSGVITVELGRLTAGGEMIVEIKYVQICASQNGFTRLVIPTFLAPRYGTAMVVARSSYSVDFSLKYISASKITVSSPSHSIACDSSGAEYNISLESGAIPNSDIIIDIHEEHESYPTAYINGDRCCYRFDLHLPAMKRNLDGEYIFLLDISKSMEGEKYLQAKNALLLCLNGLSVGDRFNIIAFESRCHYFSISCIPFDQSSLDSAQRWLDNLKPMGGTEMFEAVRHAYEGLMGKGVILLITDGQISDGRRLTDYIKKQSGVQLYTVGIDSAVNMTVINELARAGHGDSAVIHLDERIDDIITYMFDRMVTGSMDDVKVTLTDSTVSELSPRAIDRIFSGEAVTVCCRYSGNLPRRMLLQGLFMGEEYSEMVDFIKTEGGEIVDYICGKMLLDSLENQLTGENNARNNALIQEITRVSLDTGILTAYTAFAMKMGRAEKADYEVVVPILMPKAWTNVSTVLSDHDRGAAEMLSTQNADGSFGKGSLDVCGESLYIIMSSKENIVKYRWQIRKGMQYAMSEIHKGNYNRLTSELITAFDLWLKNLSAIDDLSKYIEAIVHMNRDLIK